MLNSLADAYEATGQHLRELTYFDEWLKDCRAKLGTNHPETLSALSSVGTASLAYRLFVDAEFVLRELLVYREPKEPAASSTFNTKSMLGAALHGQKKYVEAAPLFVNGYEGMHQRKSKIPPHIRMKRLTEALDRLVKMHDECGKPDEMAEWKAEREKLEQSLKNEIGDSK